MGQAGEDIIFSPAARKVFPLSIECKNVERINIPSVFEEHYEKYKDTSHLKLLIHSKNRSEVLVTLRWKDLLEYLRPNDNKNAQ